jgi:phage I-like protein
MGKKQRIDYIDGRSMLGLFKVTLDEAGGLPEWIQLIPAGLNIKARDGRSFDNPNPYHVVKAFNDDTIDLPIDYEHASELDAARGSPAPAAGWIVELKVVEGGVWGRVEWTKRGAESLETREYRYISPAFLHKGKNVTKIVSAGLTNRPALDLPQLASDALTRGVKHRTMERTMDPKLLALLGLNADATDEQVLSVATQLKVDAEKFRLENEQLKKSSASVEKQLEETKVALASAQKAEPSLDQFVPRADHDVVVARAETAETKLKEAAKTAHDEKVNTAIEKALEAGKITPATKDYYVSQCATEGGLEMFQQFVDAAPVVAPDTDLDIKRPTDKTQKLTDEQRKIAQNCGVSEEQFLASLS